MRTVISVADRLTSEALGVGIEIGSLALSPITGISIYAERDEDTPLLAEALGLTDEHLMDSKSGRVIKFFDGDRRGIKVQTHYEITPATVTA